MNLVVTYNSHYLSIFQLPLPNRIFLARDEWDDFRQTAKKSSVRQMSGSYIPTACNALLHAEARSITSDTLHFGRSIRTQHANSG